MMRTTLSLVSFLLLVSLAGGGCGSGEPAAPGIPAGRIDPALNVLSDWEWFRETNARVPLVMGRVESPDGKPVPAARVTAFLPPPAPISTPKLLGTHAADADGVFRLTDLPETAWIFADAPGFSGRLRGALQLVPREGRLEAITLGAQTTLSGTILDDAGVPVPGIQVMATMKGPAWFMVVFTDGEGRYVFPAAPRARVSVWIVPGRYHGGHEVVDLSDGEPKVHDLTARIRPAVTGQVVSEETGLPIPGAVVSGLIDREFLVEADEQGRFRLEGAVQPVVLVRAYGYAEQPVQLDPARVEEQDVRVALAPGAVARGRVTDEQGGPVPGVRVYAHLADDRGGRVVRGPLTDAEGRFDLSWLPVAEAPSRVTFSGTGVGRLAGVGEAFSIVRGQVKEGVTFQMPAPIEWTGRVEDDQGKPLPGAFLTCHFKTDRSEVAAELLEKRVSAISAEDGTFRLTGLRPGAQELTVRPPRRVPFVQKIVIGTGEGANPAKVVVPRGMAISGRVAAAGSAGFPAATVFVTSVGGSLREEFPVGSDGLFRIEGLDAGEYWVHAVAEGHEANKVQVAAGAEDLLIYLRGLSTMKIEVVPPEGVELSGHVEVRGLEGEALYRNTRTRMLGPEARDFELEGLPAGTYLVTVEAGDLYARREVVVARGAPVELRLELLRGGTIQGGVSLPDGRLISGVPVEYVYADGRDIRRGADTDVEGIYRFTGVPPGDVTVRVHPSGYPPTVKEVTVVAGETVTADLVLQTGGRLRIVVKDGSGRPLAGVPVGLVDGFGEIARYWLPSGGRPVTAEDGSLLLIGLLPGKYLATARGDAGEGRTADIEVRDAELTEAEIVLVP